MSRYTDNGTVFFKKREAKGGHEVAWVVQVNYMSGYGGAPFKTVKWATWSNDHMPFGYQESNEPVDMLSWEKAEPADIVLYASKEVAEKIDRIQNMVRLGYRGQHFTPQSVMDELEWKMSQ